MRVCGTLLFIAVIHIIVVHSLMGSSWMLCTPRGILCIIDASQRCFTIFPWSLEHPCQACISSIICASRSILLLSHLSCRSHPLIIRYLARKDIVGLISQRPICLQTLLDRSDVRSTNWLWFAQYEVFILAVEAGEFAFEVQVEVGLHGVEEHDRILAWCLKNVIHDVLRFEVVELHWAEVQAVGESEDL